MITVMHGCSEMLVMNANCVALHLLQSLQEKLGLEQDRNLVLDLADEYGNIQQLHCNLMEYASKFLTSRARYVAVRKDGTSTEPQASKPDTAKQEKSDHKFLPLLNDYENVLPEYQLDPSNPQTQSTRTRKVSAQKLTDVSNLEAGKPRPKSLRRQSITKQQ